LEKKKYVRKVMIVGKEQILQNMCKKRDECRHKVTRIVTFLAYNHVCIYICTYASKVPTIVTFLTYREKCFDLYVREKSYIYICINGFWGRGIFNVSDVTIVGQGQMTPQICLLLLML